MGAILKQKVQKKLVVLWWDFKLNYFPRLQLDFYHTALLLDVYLDFSRVFFLKKVNHRPAILLLLKFVSILYTTRYTIPCRKVLLKSTHAFAKSTEFPKISTK